jgi:hypothetical protein
VEQCDVEKIFFESRPDEVKRSAYKILEMTLKHQGSDAARMM